MQLQAGQILIRLDTILNWTWLKTRLWRIDLHSLQWHALHKGPKSHNFHNSYNLLNLLYFYPSKPVFISVKNWGCCSMPSFSWLSELCGRHNIGGLYSNRDTLHDFRPSQTKDWHRETIVAISDSPWLFHDANLSSGIAENCEVCLGLYILLLFMRVNICVEETQRKPQYGIESKVCSILKCMVLGWIQTEELNIAQTEQWHIHVVSSFLCFSFSST